MSLVSFPSRKKRSGETEDEKKSIFSRYSFSRADFTEYTKIFFGQYIYYIGTLLFYLSLFLILKALLGGIDIPVIFLCFNILVVTLYFYQNKFPLFQDFIRINILVVSLFYVFQSLQYVFGFSEIFGFIGFTNIFFVFLLFYFSLTSSTLKDSLSAMSSYAFIFTFLQGVVLYKVLFGDAIFGGSLLAFLLGIICLFFTQDIAEKLSIRRGQVRIWGLLCLYIFVSFSSLYLFGEDAKSVVFLLFLGITSYFLFVFHERFQNYISLFFSSYAFSLIGLGVYGFIIPQSIEATYIFVLCFLLSGAFLLGDRVSPVSHVYDKYFFRSFSIVVNLIGVICFLYFIEVSILKLAFLLFGECLYFFYSYYSLRNTNLSGLNTLHKTQK